MQQLFQRFKSFLQDSPTPFHATAVVEKRLLDAGFKRLLESQAWDLQANERYYVVRNEASIIAFTHVNKEKLYEGISMIGAHTDSPALKIKPKPDLKKAGVNQLCLEVYGGALLNPWFDRDLSIAGRVHYQTKSGTLASKLIDFKRPIAVIPSLAIHLDKDANSNRSINAQKDLPAIISLESDQSFHALLKNELNEAELEEVLSFDLLLYDVQTATQLGSDKALVCAARLDNLLSCFAAVQSMVKSPKNRANLIVFNDHEEIGSHSAHGAQSNFLESVLERMIGNRDDFARIMDKSVMISTDNAHALHPNFSDIHEPNHAPLIGKGVAIKYNANQAYATSSSSSALFQSYAKKAGKELQSYVVRSDTRCGSTIGPITATKLGLETIDIGVPTWGMHSIRETAALKDIDDLIRILEVFFQEN